MHDLTPEEQEDLNLAFVAGLTKRNGPSAAEIETWSPWKRLVCRLTPRKYRWHYSVNAPVIRDFETRL